MGIKWRLLENLHFSSFYVIYLLFRGKNRNTRWLKKCPLLSCYVHAWEGYSLLSTIVAVWKETSENENFSWVRFWTWLFWLFSGKLVNWCPFNYFLCSTHVRDVYRLRETYFSFFVNTILVDLWGGWGRKVGWTSDRYALGVCISMES